MFAFPKRKMPLHWRILVVLGWVVTTLVVLTCGVVLWGFAQIKGQILETESWLMDRNPVDEALVKMIQQRIEKEVKEGKTSLSLNGDAHEFHLLAQWMFPQTAVDITQHQSTLTVQISHQTLDGRYANMKWEGQLQISNGNLKDLKLDQAIFGKIETPDFLLPYIENFLAYQIETFMKQRQQKDIRITLQDLRLEDDRFFLSFYVKS